MLTIQATRTAQYPQIFSIMRANMERYHQQYAIAWDQDWMDANYRNKENYSLLLRNDLVGFVSIESRPDELYIHTLQLTAALQGRVYGYQIYQWLLSLAEQRAASAISCKSFRDNPAIELYQRVGFDVLATEGFLVSLSLALDSARAIVGKTSTFTAE